MTNIWLILVFLVMYFLDQITAKDVLALVLWNISLVMIIDIVLEEASLPLLIYIYVYVFTEACSDQDILFCYFFN